ncbi:phosphoglycolate phosphatase [Aestuariispira ectoiniformans]|uniref:phosphoglycolate phosphatase n=1 Tax=Aestuariispira ectoiniformans TaxID=2775080 RepID=UPI0021AF516A|nr:phosphoglycolate phosphatase [Aestuariispira ectoiniformans]
MTEPMTFRHTLVFDLDGTLIESDRDLARAANRLLAERDRPALTLDRVRSFVGDGARKLVERCFEATGGLPASLDDLTARFIALYEENIADETTAFDGVHETLTALRAKGHRLAVCTNKPETATRRLLDILGLADYFEDLVGGDSLPVRKPDPGHILALLDRMQVSPKDAVMVGDSGNDIFAGRDAGLKTILVTFGYCRTPHEKLPADAMVDHFSQIPDILAQFSQPHRKAGTNALDSAAPAP